MPRKKSTTKKIKKFAGRHNFKGKEEIAFTMPEMYGTEWVMYRRTASPDPAYSNFKLVAATKCESKANYWLSWKNEERKFVYGSDFVKMAEYRMDLLAMLDQYMQIFA